MTSPRKHSVDGTSDGRRFSTPHVFVSAKVMPASLLPHNLHAVLMASGIFAQFPDSRFAARAEVLEIGKRRGGRGNCHRDPFKAGTVGLHSLHSIDQ